MTIQVKIIRMVSDPFSGDLPETLYEGEADSVISDGQAIAWVGTDEVVTETGETKKLSDAVVISLHSDARIFTPEENPLVNMLTSMAPDKVTIFVGAEEAHGSPEEEMLAKLFDFEQ